jgi:hypothetical protein
MNLSRAITARFEKLATMRVFGLCGKNYQSKLAPFIARQCGVVF